MFDKTRQQKLNYFILFSLVSLASTNALADPNGYHFRNEADSTAHNTVVGNQNYHFRTDEQKIESAQDQYRYAAPAQPDLPERQASIQYSVPARGYSSLAVTMPTQNYGNYPYISTDAHYPGYGQYNPSVYYNQNPGYRNENVYSPLNMMPFRSESMPFNFNW